MVQYIEVIDVMSNGTLVPIHNHCSSGGKGLPGPFSITIQLA